MNKTVIGKVESINKGSNYCNTSIILEDKSRFNVKLEMDDDSKLTIGKVYVFEVESYLKEEVTLYKATKITAIEDHGLSNKAYNELMNSFYDFAPKPLKVYERFQKSFYLHPAATKFHHAYVGGLSYHTLTMLSMIDPLVDVYPYLNRDLLYAATILHDVCKIDEMTGVDGEYTVEGQLIGHLVMGALEVEKSAIKLGVENSEEVLLLKHLIVSHHGQLNFGSPKKPQTGEALLLWFIDTIDSKFTELGEALKQTKPGEFTQAINVLDKARFYKPKL
jgi:3'-5' exoribonuclease